MKIKAQKSAWNLGQKAHETGAILFVPFLFILLALYPSATSASSLTCLQVDGMSIFGYKYNEYIYIGSIANEFSSDSIANDFGWGSKFKSDSIMNEFGTFGGKFSSYSAFNDFASKPPIIINSDYKFVGYLTTNDFKLPNINTYEAIACANNSFKSAIYGYDDITFKDIPSSANSGANSGLSCPANSILIGSSCICNDGYVSNGVSCITYTQNCQNTYGQNSYGDKNYCYCSAGYEFNSGKTACIQSVSCPTNSTKIGNSCFCNEGYLMRNNACITYTQDCMNTFGSNVYGIKGNNNSFCYCNNGYQWNASKTACIANVAIQGTNNNGSVLGSITIPEGALIRTKGDIDVYIVKHVGAKKFKRLILSPHVFESYAHFDKNGNGNKWDDILDIDQSVVDSFATSDLVRAVGDAKVYQLTPQGDTGIKRWVNLATQVFLSRGYDSDAIYEINQTDKGAYITGNDIQ